MRVEIVSDVSILDGPKSAAVILGNKLLLTAY